MEGRKAETVSFVWLYLVEVPNPAWWCHVQTSLIRMTAKSSVTNRGTESVNIFIVYFIFSWSLMWLDINQCINNSATPAGLGNTTESPLACHQFLYLADVVIPPTCSAVFAFEKPPTSITEGLLAIGMNPQTAPTLPLSPCSGWTRCFSHRIFANPSAANVSVMASSARMRV